MMFQSVVPCTYGFVWPRAGGREYFKTSTFNSMTAPPTFYMRVQRDSVRRLVPAVGLNRSQMRFAYDGLRRIPLTVAFRSRRDDHSD